MSPRLRQRQILGKNLVTGDQILVQDTGYPLYVDSEMVGVPLTLGEITQSDSDDRQHLRTITNPDGEEDRKWFDNTLSYTRVARAEELLADIQAPVHQRELDL